jgi:hypothetical protein
MPAVKQVRSLALVVAALAALLVPALAGCSSPSHDPAANGPLASGTGKDGRTLGHGGSVCLPRFNGWRETFGDVWYTNYGHTTVVLDRVVLLRPRDEHLFAAEVVPGKHLIGAIPWPPNWPSVRGAWKTRQPVHGYRVAPGKTFDEVIGVEPTGPRNATSQGTLLYYHDHAGSYVAPNYFGVQIAARKCKD